MKNDCYISPCKVPKLIIFVSLFSNFHLMKMLASTRTLLVSCVLISSVFSLSPKNLPHSLRSRLEKYSHPLLTPQQTTPSIGSGEDVSPGVRVTPLDFGADPTGKSDSSDAIQSCVQFCVNYSSVIDFLGHFPGDASFGNGKYIRNAGGCVIDLSGGEYLLSKPIVFPEYIANINFGHGSLVADPTPGVFPPDSFLLVVGIAGSCKIPQGSCNIDINFPELFLDGSHVASGIQVNNVMGSTLGPGSYLLNFTSYGVQINGGHELMISRCWLGETNFDYPFSKTDLPTAIAIQVNGNDHYIQSTVVFSSKIGLEVNGAANYITGVHVWFPSNQALAFVDEGVKAFHITGWQNRFVGCYIDGSRAVFDTGGLNHNIWVDGFECCAGVADVPHGIMLLGDSIGGGMVIENNIFCGGNIFSVPATPGKAVAVKGTRIESNSFCGQGVGSKATLSLTQTAASQWNFTFCDYLVFPTISRVKVSVIAASGFPTAIARPPVGCSVLVETSESVTGTVSVEVDSSDLDSEFV
jgi:hypothetical protein